MERRRTMAQTIARVWRGTVAALCITICSATVALPQGAGSHAGEPPAAEPVKTGLEVFLSHPPSVVVGKRVGLITNPTGVDRSLRSTIDLLAARTDMRLVALFGPEHGVRGEAASWLANSKDARTQLPV